MDALDDRLNGYHSYKYIGEQLNYFLNFTTHKTELIFNGDYLTAVIITIKHSDIAQLNSINQILVLDASKEIVIDDNTRKFKIDRVVYYIIYKKPEKDILIIYGKSRFIQRNLIKLLNL